MKIKSEFKVLFYTVDTFQYLMILFVFASIQIGLNKPFGRNHA